MSDVNAPRRAQEATLSARPSDPRLREAQRLHHEERQFQRQADEARRQRGAAETEAKQLTIAKTAHEAEIQQLSRAVDDSRQQLFEARDRVKALELEAISVERSDPAKAADIREAAAAVRSEIPELERFAGTHQVKLQEAWDEVKVLEAQLETRTADAARLAAESERLRTLAEERESAAESLEQQRNAEPMRADVPDVDLFEPDRLREALRLGHRVSVGTDGHLHVSEERGQPMSDEQLDYLESKLPELRHRVGEGWSFSIETDGSIGGTGPWNSHYFASANGQPSAKTLAEVRARVGDGYDVSVAPDGTIVTSQPTAAVGADQARQNLATFNREVESGALTERMASGQGYDLNPDGTGGYSAIAPMTSTDMVGDTDTDTDTDTTAAAAVLPVPDTEATTPGPENLDSPPSADDGTDATVGTGVSVDDPEPDLMPPDPQPAEPTEWDDSADEVDPND